MFMSLVRVALLLATLNILAFFFKVSITSPLAVFNPTSPDFYYNPEVDCRNQDNTYKKFLCVTNRLDTASRDVDITAIFGDWVIMSQVLIEVLLIGNGLAELIPPNFTAIQYFVKIIYTVVLAGAIVAFISGRQI